MMLVLVLYLICRPRVTKHYDDNSRHRAGFAALFWAGSRPIFISVSISFAVEVLHPFTCTYCMEYHKDQSLGRSFSCSTRRIWSSSWKSEACTLTYMLMTLSYTASAHRIEPNGSPGTSNWRHSSLINWRIGLARNVTERIIYILSCETQKFWMAIAVRQLSQYSTWSRSGAV